MYRGVLIVRPPRRGDRRTRDRASASRSPGCGTPTRTTAMTRRRCRTTTRAASTSRRGRQPHRLRRLVGSRSTSTRGRTPPGHQREVVAGRHRVHRPRPRRGGMLSLESTMGKVLRTTASSGVACGTRGPGLPALQYDVHGPPAPDRTRCPQGAQRTARGGPERPLPPPPRSRCCPSGRTPGVQVPPPRNPQVGRSGAEHHEHRPIRHRPAAWPAGPQRGGAASAGCLSSPVDAGRGRSRATAPRGTMSARATPPLVIDRMRIWHPDAAPTLAARRQVRSQGRRRASAWQCSSPMPRPLPASSRSTAHR